MSQDNLKRMEAVNSYMKLALTLGAIAIGLSGWVVLPDKLEAISERTAKLEAKHEAVADVVSRLDERLAAIQKILERMEGLRK